jgi:hypothetical protein
MSSRKTKLAAVATGAIAAAGLGAGLLASSASAATAYIPPTPTPHVCDYKLGPNILKLTLGSTDFYYPTLLRVADNGVVRGVLFDNGLPVGQQYLRVHGLCVGSTLAFDTNYPGGQAAQGTRGEIMNITQVSPHRGTAKGVFDETGALAENGTASFVFQIFRP